MHISVVSKAASAVNNRQGVANIPPTWSAFVPYHPTQSQQPLGFGNEPPFQTVCDVLSAFAWGNKMIMLLVSVKFYKLLRRRRRWLQGTDERRKTRLTCPLVITGVLDELGADCTIIL